MIIISSKYIFVVVKSGLEKWRIVGGIVCTYRQRISIFNFKYSLQSRQLQFFLCKIIILDTCDLMYYTKLGI